jgi:site-specific DNA-methyltransferase (adenine-specific)
MSKRRIGDATLILGDAFHEMPKLSQVDSIITDPPYNARTHRGARSAASLASSAIDFDCIDEEQFIAFCTHAVTLATRWVVMSCSW